MISTREFPETTTRDKEAGLIASGDGKTNNSCHHYWLIDRANGPLSRAVCKYCHEERQFSNLPPEYNPENGGTATGPRRENKKIAAAV
jgi:hypothetical protein